MTRRTSLGEPLDSALNRNIDSKYDVILEVSKKISEIEDINAAIEDGTLDNMLNIINMLVATGEPGTEVTWDGTTLTVPRGDAGATGEQGSAGYNGLTPNYEFTYNSTSGMLGYELANYTDVNTGSTVDISSIVDQVVTEISTLEE